MGEERDEVTEPTWEWNPDESVGYLDLDPLMHVVRESQTLEFSNLTLILDLTPYGRVLGIEVLK